MCRTAFPSQLRSSRTAGRMTPGNGPPRTFPRWWRLPPPSILVGSLLLAVGAAGALADESAQAKAVVVEATVIDSQTRQPLAARIYVQDAQGGWHFAAPGSSGGQTVPYRKERSPTSVEMHTAVSAHPFQLRLPPGTYTVTVERGKEYVPLRQKLEVPGRGGRWELPLRRWINAARYHWYSGDTHVHRPLTELPTAMLADDVNVAFPLTYWVTRAHTPPDQGDKNSPPAKADVMSVDDTHVIYPLNTEYEIFSVAGRPHTLGAVFALNHRQVLGRGVPPVRPIAEQVHREGGFLELDKHNWPWSMMLVPVMSVDLFELANNHHWRTEFLFRDFGEPAAEYMKIERDERGFTEAGWTEFGLQNYYALLNCGLRLRPTAGTASGVHPVPLGFGRVYVQLPSGFSYDAWCQGLLAGRSFVTTGPLLFLQVNDAPPGHTFQQGRGAVKYRVAGTAHSLHPLTRLEIISAGEVVKTIQPLNTPQTEGGFLSAFDVELEIFRSTWLAVRCDERTDEGRLRFAHSSPVHIEVTGRPLRPRRVEVEYLAGRVRAELQRHQDVLDPAALAEYHEALEFYEKLSEQAR